MSQITGISAVELCSSTLWGAHSMIGYGTQYFVSGNERVVLVPTTRPGYSQSEVHLALADRLQLPRHSSPSAAEL